LGHDPEGHLKAIKASNSVMFVHASYRGLSGGGKMLGLNANQGDERRRKGQVMASIEELGI